jgi:hypothetical protein
MRVYRPTDAVEPIVANLQTGDGANGLSPWVVGPGLIVFASLLWIPHSPFVASEDNSLIGSMVRFGFGLALAMAGVSILSRRIPALARLGTRHRMAIILGFIASLIATFGPVALLAFMPGMRPIGMLFVIGFVINFAIIPLWLLQRRNARRIAAEMREAAKSGSTPTAVVTAQAVEVASPGGLVIELYETADLPHAVPLHDRVTQDSNIVGQPPCRLLHLYNFFADAISAKTRPLGAWRLHGSVTMLASPLELARAGGYKLDLAQSIESQLLLTPASIDARVAAMSDTPLPPRQSSSSDWWWRRLNKSTRKLKKWMRRESNSALPELFEDCGAYPEEVLLCTDQTWQLGVAALTARADKAIMDASDFNTERLGLVWEIQHVLNHFATEDFVVLVNSFTDLPALCAEFRRAWANMSAASPNNRRDEARLRLILLIGDDQGGWDDDNSLGGRSEDIRDFERIAAHHRIVALLRASGESFDAATRSLSDSSQEGVSK